MKRVCLLCENWESGGIESFLYNILLFMNFSVLDIDVVASKLGESVFTKPLKDRGVRFYELSGKVNGTVQNYRAFRKLLANRRYDVVHLHIYHGLSLVYARLAKEAGVPIRIAHSHNTDLRKSPARWLKLMLHWWGAKRYTGDCTHLWACSTSAAKFVFSSEDIKKQGVTLISNGIDTERFRVDIEVREKIRRTLGLDNTFVVGNVGRLCYQKNQSFLLEVFREIVTMEPDSRLLLVGEGEDLSALENQARGLGISKKVIFYGVSRHVEQLLWAMDVFVFPSRFEGFGIVSVEAQAAGLPVLCSENIPDEALFTERAIQMDLSLGVKAWAKTVLKMKALLRKFDSSVAVDAGFDAAHIARRIEGFYLRGDDGEQSADFYHRSNL